jgi:hypothetical protein
MFARQNQWLKRSPNSNRLSATIHFATILQRSDKALKRDAFAAGTSASRF